MDSSPVFERFTNEAKGVLFQARRFALSLGAAELDDLHILIACCRTPDTLAGRVLLECGQAPESIADSAEVLARASATSECSDCAIPFTPRARKVLELMMAEADGMVHWVLGSHHILLGLVTSEGPASGVLIGAGLALGPARTVAERIQEDLVVGAKPERAPADATTKAVQLKKLLAAKDVCVELQQFEVASKLRDLAHWLERS